MLSPGTVESTFDLRCAGPFPFTYHGQIHLLGLSRLAEMSSRSGRASEQFVAMPCWDDDFNERDWTEGVIAKQRKPWEATVADCKGRAAPMALLLLGG